MFSKCFKKLTISALFILSVFFLAGAGQLCAAQEYTASGTYTYVATDLAVTTTISNFTCDGLAVGIEHFTVLSVTETTMEWQEDGGNMIWTRPSGSAGNIVGTWLFTDGSNSYTLTINGDNTFVLTAAIIAESGSCISGQIYAGSSNYTSGNIYVAVYNALFPDGNLQNSIILTAPGSYNIGGIPDNTDLWVYARWDKDGSGTRTPGDWVGYYPSNPVVITGGVNPTNIDISLTTVIPAASVSGNVLSSDFAAGFGDLKVFAYDGPNPATANVLKVTTILSASVITTSIPYTLTDLAVSSYVYIFARWDKDGNVDPSPADYRGSYNQNPLLIESGGHTGINIALNPGAQQFTASGTYTYVANDLAVTTTDSDFVCDGLRVGFETFTVTSLTVDTMIWKESDGYELTWTRTSGETTAVIVGTWEMVEAPNSYVLTISDDTFVLNGTISGCVMGDLNYDGSVDLTDAILALQVVIGLPPPGGVEFNGDVNGDGRIGVEEALNALQALSGLRPSGTQ